MSYARPRSRSSPTSSGELLTEEQATDPAYWVRHAREPVRFAERVEALARTGAATYLEVGPDPLLSAMAAETPGPQRQEAAFIPTLREGRKEQPSAAAPQSPRPTPAASSSTGQAFFKGTGAKAPVPAHLPLPEEALLAAQGPGAATPPRSARRALTTRCSAR